MNYNKNQKTAFFRCCAIAFILGGLLATTPFAEAIPIRATGNPVVTGSGASMTARWSNVGEIDGSSIDLYLEVVSHTGSASWVMVTENDDFKFQFTDGTNGEQRSATLKWTFYETGTNTPATVSNLAFTVDDLDDNARHESLSTSDAYDYTVNTPTNLNHANSNGTVSAAGAGGIAHSTGDPEGAVKLLFTEKSSIVITYSTEFDGATVSAFHHDGDGDFVFDSPPIQLYYTFNLTNNEAQAVAVDFHNTLPEGLIWDSDYMELVGTLTGNPIEFSNGNTTVSGVDVELHPGTNSLTLRTLETSMTGQIQNEATMDPKHPQLPPIVLSTTINLP